MSPAAKKAPRAKRAAAKVEAKPVEAEAEVPIPVVQEAPAEATARRLKRGPYHSV